MNSVNSNNWLLLSIQYPLSTFFKTHLKTQKMTTDKSLPMILKVAFYV